MLGRLRLAAAEASNQQCSFVGVNARLACSLASLHDSVLRTTSTTSTNSSGVDAGASSADGVNVVQPRSSSNSSQLSRFKQQRSHRRPLGNSATPTTLTPEPSGPPGSAPLPGGPWRQHQQPWQQQQQQQPWQQQQQQQQQQVRHASSSSKSPPHAHFFSAKATAAKAVPKVGWVVEHVPPALHSEQLQDESEALGEQPHQQLAQQHDPPPPQQQQQRVQQEQEPGVSASEAHRLRATMQHDELSSSSSSTTRGLLEAARGSGAAADPTGRAIIASLDRRGRNVPRDQFSVTSPGRLASAEPLPDPAAPPPPNQQQQQHHAGPSTAAQPGPGVVAAQQQQEQQQQGPNMPIFAVHMAGEIDFAKFAAVANAKHMSIVKDHALLQFDEMSDDRVLMGEGGSEPVEKRIMVVWRFGSVVFFNTHTRARERLLQRLRPFVIVPSGGPAAADAAAAGIAPNAGASAFEGLRQDATSLQVRSSMPEWSVLEPDKIVVQALDIGNIRVVSHILAQSVALDYYNEKVDLAIQQFNPYLVEVARSGQCNNIKEAKLLQHIANNSLLYTDVVTKIGLLDISQTAWTQDRYHHLWQSLRTDYDLDRRFEAINRKLGPMIENAKFLLDIRAETKSSNAEVTIIVLIMLEVALSFVGHIMH